MAKLVSPDKGKEIGWYRDEKLGAEWQKAAFDLVAMVIAEVYPAVRSSIKWSQPVWETQEGPMVFFRGSAKHVTLGFWRGAEMNDTHNMLEGEGDRMKHLKFKRLEDVDPILVRGYVQQAVQLNAQKGDPTKGK
jgi:hypothetical protein